MVVVNVPASGYSNFKIVVSDHATPASGTYALYFNSESCRRKWSMKNGSYMNGAEGHNQGLKGYYLDSIYTLKMIIQNNTDYQNFLKALHYWEKNNTLLYLNVQNEWGQNLALFGDYDTPTTLEQMQGKLYNLEEAIFAANVEITILFAHLTQNILIT